MKAIKQNKKIKTTILTTIIILLIISTFLFHFKSLLYDIDFYNDEYEKNGIYIKFDKLETWKNTFALWDYMKSNTDSIGTDFFSEKDKLHMIDVRNLINKTLLTYYVAGILFLLLTIIYCKLYGIQKLSKILICTGSSILLLLILAAILSPIFQYLFFLFHKIFFTNELWLLNPNIDNLINLYPEQFFKDFTISIFIHSSICAIFYLGTGLFLRKHLNYKKSKNKG
jgi:integral membrane protein (TIGR01906 family)